MDKPKIQEIKESVIGIVGSIFAIVIVVGILNWLLSSNIIYIFGGEKEGIIKFDDCREIIRLKDNPYQKFYKSFTCDYVKTATGKIMSGTCVHVKTSWLSGKCEQAYIYDKEPEIKCLENGYLGYDGRCYCNSGYFYNKNTKKCEPIQ